MRLDLGLESTPWKRLGLNSAWLFAGRLATQIQLVIFTLLAARGLGVAGFGQYTFIVSAVALGNVLTSFGTDTLLIRELARARDGKDHRISSALILQLGLSAFILAIIYAWSGLLPNANRDTISGLRLYAFALAPLAFFSIFTAVLRAWERMDLYLGANLLAAGLQTGLAWFMLQGESRLVPFMAMLLAVQVCAAVIAGVLCWKAIPGFSIRFKVDWKSLAGLARLVWPLALISILGVAYQRLGVLVISVIQGDVQTGWYSAASRMVEVLKFGHIAVLGAIFPAVSHLSAEAKRGREANFLFQVAFWGLLGVAVLSSISAYLLAPWLVATSFGQTYLPAVPVLRTLVWVLIPYTLTSTLSLRMILVRREKAVMLVTGCGLAIALGLNLFMISTFGATGAALASLSAECIMAGIFLFLREKG
ncbi:MAG: flippase [Anaerolineaceae bacterium]|nr:flippase [Anaerolineaceae bacterium]